MFLSFTVKLSYSVGHVLNDAAASMWFSYMLVYLIYVLKIWPQNAGLLLLLGQVIDGLYTPILGVLLGKPYFSPKNFGLNYNPRKFWHLIGVICVALTVPLLFSRCDSCAQAGEMVQLLYLCLLVIIFQLGWATTQVSHLSLIPDMSPFETERDQLNNMKHAFNVSMNILAYAVVWIIFEVMTSSDGEPTLDPTDAVKFQIIVLILISIGIITSIIFHVGTEVPKSIHLEQGDKNTLHWKVWLTNKSFLVVAVLNICSQMFRNLGSIYVPVYLQEGLKTPEASLATVPLLTNFCGLLSSIFLVKWLTRMLGKKIVLLLGNLLGFVGLLLLVLLSREKMITYGIYFFSILTGPSITLIHVTNLSLTSDLISTFTKDSSFVYGCMCFIEKIANGILVFAIEAISQKACEDCSLFFTWVTVIVLATPLIISTTIMLSVKRKLIMIAGEEDF